MISPCIPDENVSAARRGKEVIVPLVINTYNNMMGGADQSDQISYNISFTNYGKIWRN